VPSPRLWLYHVERVPQISEWICCTYFARKCL
jgi:hypothetical protein